MTQDLPTTATTVPTVRLKVRHVYTSGFEFKCQQIRKGDDVLSVNEGVGILYILGWLHSVCPVLSSLGQHHVCVT